MHLMQLETRDFTYAMHRMRVLFGQGARRQLAFEMQHLRCARAFIISGPHGASAARDLAKALGAACVGFFPQAAMHTPVDVTESALAQLTQSKASILVSLGGGSATGLSKALALRTDLPQIALPTTYAGSEMTSILGETKEGRKTTIRDEKVLPETVIYDPELTLSLPVSLSMTSGMNALAHAVEALYAPDRNPLTSLLAREGIAHLVRALPTIHNQPAHPEARESALYGSWLCGAALAAVAMGLHHKLCHVLGGTFNLPHAETHSVLLPHVTSFNAEAAPKLLQPVRKILEAPGPGRGLYALARTLDAPMSLKEIGLPEDALDKAADVAVQQPYTNPQPVTRAGIRQLLEDAWRGRRPAN
jgi:maleylacetate reductase